MANWITRAMGAFLPKREAVYGPLDDYWYQPVDMANYAGVTLRPDTAMAVSAVYACVRVLSDSLGSLPLKLYRWTGDDQKEKEPARDHPVWRLLQKRPNRWMTPQEWKSMGVGHLYLRGDYFNRIVGTGFDMQLIPLSPDRVEVEQLETGYLKYTYRTPGKAPEIIPQDDMLHIRGMTLNGVSGVSVLEFARNSIGSSVSQEKHGSTLVGKGAVPPFWISRPAARRWTDVARKEFRKNWRSLHGGAENAANPPILGDDMELHPLQISNRDMQFIEGRQFNAEEICGFFGVHPALVFKSKETAGNNEEISQQYKTYTLAPLAIRFEQAVDRDLLDDAEADTHFARFNLDALTRATILQRYEAHNYALQGGWLSVNRIREIEDENPVPGGDELRFPSNMQPAGGGPDINEQGGQPGKGTPKESERPQPEQLPPAPPRRRRSKANTKAAFRILFASTGRRLAGREIRLLGSRAARASEDRDLFNEWARGIYAEHATAIVEIIDPICAAWLAQTKREVSPEDVVAAMAALITPVFDTEVDVPTLLGDWKTTRAAELATTLEEVFFNGKS